MDRAGSSPPVHGPWRRRAGESPRLIAHRGAPTEAPENTLASFRVALQAGADVLEMDVRTTADGELVVVHDATVDRTSDGRGAVAALTLAELRRVRLRHPKTLTPDAEPIPRLEDVLRAFPRAAMNVDLKAVAADAVAQVFAWIRDINAVPENHLQVLLTSAHAEIQAAIVGHNGAGEVALGMGRDDVVAVIWAAWLRRPPIERLRGRACQIPAHLDGLGIHVPLLWGPLAAYLRRLDCPLHVWWDAHGMVDDAARLRACARWGADAVFTDEVRTMATLGEKELAGR